MYLYSFITIIVAILHLSECSFASVSTFAMNVLIRGGRSSSIKKSNVQGNCFKKKNAIKNKRKDKNYDIEDDDNDEDDDEEEEESRITSKAKRGNSGSKGKRSQTTKSKKKMQMIPWGFPNVSQKKVAGFKERLEQLAKQGQSVYKEVYRRAKVLRSSAFEGLLLKATWPGDTMVPQSILDEIIKHSIPAFKYGRTDSEDDPYYMTMHKLWTKMCEKDWRTVVKSLFILHSISRESSIESCHAFSSATKDMMKTRNPKKPDHRYFDLKMISDVDEKGSPYIKFVRYYASFVLFRTKTFSSRFEELKSIQDDNSLKKILTSIKKSQQCISMILECDIEPKKLQNVVVAQIMKQLVADLRDVWSMYSKMVNILIRKLDAMSSLEGELEDGVQREELLEVLNAYQDLMNKSTAYVSNAAKKYNVRFKLKIPSDLLIKQEPNGNVGIVPLEKVAESLDRITKLSGGFVKPKKRLDRAGSAAPSARRVAMTLLERESEEDIEEEDGDDDETEYETEEEEEEDGEKEDASDEEEDEVEEGEQEEVDEKKSDSDDEDGENDEDEDDEDMISSEAEDLNELEDVGDEVDDDSTGDDEDDPEEPEKEIDGKSTDDDDEGGEDDDDEDDDQNDSKKVGNEDDEDDDEEDDDMQLGEEDEEDDDDI